MSPKITIITQAYNEEQYLDRCIQSVLGQTYADFDYLLIDNGSTDRTGKIIEKYAAADARIRVIRNEENQFYAFWVKHLKELLRGEFFVSLDGDDWLAPTFLAQCVKTAQEDGSDIVCALSIFHYPDGRQEKIAPFSSRRVLTREDVVKDFYKFTCLEAIWAKMLRSSLILEADYTLVNKNIDTKSDYGLDAALLWPCIEIADKISWLPEFLYHYNADHDITFDGYHRRMPFFVRTFPVNLEQEYRLLQHWNSVNGENLGVIFEEYLQKMSACIESCFSSFEPGTEQTLRLARIFAADIGSARREILAKQSEAYAHMLETASDALARTDDTAEIEWLRTFLDNGEMRESVVFSLLVIGYLLRWRERLTKEKEGREQTIKELEADRNQKDAQLVRLDKEIEGLVRLRDVRERVLEETVHARDEKEAAIQEITRERDEKEAAIQELVKARDEKEAAIQKLVKARDEKEQFIQTLYQEREEKESAIQELVKARDEKESAIQELVRVRDEEEAAIQELVKARDEKEQFIQTLYQEREEKDRAIAQRDKTIEDLIKEREEKDEELRKREELIEELRARLDHGN